MIKKYWLQNMRSLESLKQLIRPFCKLGKCITYLNSDVDIGPARVHKAMTRHTLQGIR